MGYEKIQFFATLFQIVSKKWIILQRLNGGFKPFADPVKSGDVRGIQYKPFIENLLVLKMPM